VAVHVAVEAAKGEAALVGAESHPHHPRRTFPLIAGFRWSSSRPPIR
jgi:hypothetical protein